MEILNKQPGFRRQVWVIKRMTHLFKYRLEPPRGENCPIAQTGSEWPGNWAWRSSGAQQLVASEEDNHTKDKASIRKKWVGDFLSVQWLRLHASNTGDPSSVPGPELRPKDILKIKSKEKKGRGKTKETALWEP